MEQNFKLNTIAYRLVKVSKTSKLFIDLGLYKRSFGEIGSLKGPYFLEKVSKISKLVIDR